MKVVKSMRIDKDKGDTFNQIKQKLQESNYGFKLSDAKVFEYLISYYEEKELSKKEL